MHIMIRRLALLASLFLSFSALADDTNAPSATSPSATPAAGSGVTQTTTPSNDVGMGSDGVVKDEGNYQVRVGELYAPGGECYIVPIRIPQMSDGYHVASAH